MNPMPGIQLIADVRMVEAVGGETVPRSWRERLLTRPWRPWLRSKQVTKYAPIQKFYKIGDKFIAHPAVIAKLKEQTCLTNRATTKSTT